MVSPPIQIIPGHADSTGSPSDADPTPPRYDGPPLFSYGFRPFFLSAALWAVLAVPVWVVIWTGFGGAGFLYPPREWHVHEMLFGFVPAVMAGFLLTAVPNWTDRAPVRGRLLMALLLLWVVGRGAMMAGWPWPWMAAGLDSGFLIALATVVWRELAGGRAWQQAPVASVITLYAMANVWFHLSVGQRDTTDGPERVAMMLDLWLLTLLGGRLTPTFTREFVLLHQVPQRPAGFSWVDGGTLGLVVFATTIWAVWPQHPLAACLMVLAGLASLVRLVRWHGGATWREPLVFMLHIGYGWVGVALVLIGLASVNVGPSSATAAHALTTGAVGAMTLAVMTRASLGHTGRPKIADRSTILMYVLVNLGALLRVLAPDVEMAAGPAGVFLGLAAFCWSGAYGLFAVVYGPYLLNPALDEEF